MERENHDEKKKTQDREYELQKKIMAHQERTINKLLENERKLENQIAELHCRIGKLEHDRQNRIAELQRGIGKLEHDLQERIDKFQQKIDALELIEHDRQKYPPEKKIQQTQQQKIGELEQDRQKWIAKIQREIDELEKDQRESIDRFQQKINPFKSSGSIISRQFNYRTKRNIQRTQWTSSFDIFISYSHLDGYKGKLIAKAFENRGWCVWFDEKSLLGGENIDRYIVWALENAMRVVVLWSPNAILSEYVYSEARIAFDYKKLVSVIIEKVLLPDFCAEDRVIDLSDWDETEDSPAFKKLIDDISLILSLGKK